MENEKMMEREINDDERRRKRKGRSEEWIVE